MEYIIALIAVILVTAVGAYFIAKLRYQKMMEKKSKDKATDVIKAMKDTDEDFKNMSDSDLDKHI